MSKNTSRFSVAFRSHPERFRLGLLTLIVCAIAALLLQTQPSDAQSSSNLYISEVLPVADPTHRGMNRFEWVELHNLGPGSINLRGWFIEDAQTIARLPAIELEADEVVLIVGDSAFPIVPGGRSLIMLETARIGSGLRNDGDRVALVNPDGVRHDAVSWGDVIHPQHFPEPEPGQSIGRSGRGFQTTLAPPTPWRAELDRFEQPPDRHRHARPDHKVRIVATMVEPEAGEREWIEVANTSNQRLLTVNWLLTIGASQITVPSVLIRPGDSAVISARYDLKLGPGLPRTGGFLVLRDPHGRWLATASWGSDTRFHQLPAPELGEEIWFSDWHRLHPAPIWQNRVDQSHWQIIGDLNRPALVPSNVRMATSFQRSAPTNRQDSVETPIWISEVYPTAGRGRDDPTYEWFELTNSSGQPVDLSGWQIADNRGADPLDGLIALPMSTIAVGTSTEAGASIHPVVTDGRIGNGLANTGDQLRLINPAGDTVSAISWGDDRTFTTVKSPSADESIQRSAPGDPPLIASPTPAKLQHLSATPEAPAAEPQAQSQSLPRDTSVAGDTPAAAPTTSEPTVHTPVLIDPPLRITELMPNPHVDQPEWVEIVNPTDHSVNLSGWTLSDLAGETPLSGALGPGAYLLVTTQLIAEHSNALVVSRIGNGLNNDADVLTLRSPSGTIVDQINYGSDNAPTPDRGLSLALEPSRWVVNSEPSPGDDAVTSFLAEALRSPTLAPTETEREPFEMIEAEPDSGVSAWMIVSIALLGVIATLTLRRWRPQPTTQSQPATTATYSGPPEDLEFDR